ncbi:MAG: hypothetical protein RML72_10390 [Bacteroidia bacterium]|nr:hypothetical protein [Bacteroidia bacterium]MDW8159267.1 hypothetical protein [Bacteroidia bacterium]
MAKPSIEVIAALRQTAARLSNGATYAWSHMGTCNCGHLAQTLTSLSAAAIHQKALEKTGDWAEHIQAYCPQSGYAIDHIIDIMLETGFTHTDLIHLERLSDKAILERIPQHLRPLNYKKRENVILYLNTWADMLEEIWIQDSQKNKPLVFEVEALLS